MNKSFFVSWKTTAAGIAQWLSVVSLQAQKAFDNDATTNIDWNIVMMATFLLVGLLVARDSDKSTESHK